MRRRLMAISAWRSVAGALTALGRPPWDARGRRSKMRRRGAGESPAPSAGGHLRRTGDDGRRGRRVPPAADPRRRRRHDAGPRLRRPVRRHAARRCRRRSRRSRSADLRDRTSRCRSHGVEPGRCSRPSTRTRGTRAHEALDILAPRGYAGPRRRRWADRQAVHSERGGNTIYQFDPTERYCYYYAHLDRYARGLGEGQQSSAARSSATSGPPATRPDAPHLHFAIFRLGPERRWWEGTPIDPYPALAALPGPAIHGAGSRLVAQPCHD